jgi:hypothetical protein
MTNNLDLDGLFGWAPYAETMAPGATATVQKISFNTHYGYWYADIIFDREWSCDTSNSESNVIRRWHGPVDETPDRYEPPSAYEQEHYPQGRKHTFSMPVKHLRRRMDD